MPKIKDMPKWDRPREKFREKGPDALSKSELLAILLGSGIKGKNVKSLSEQIIRKFGKNFINAAVEDFLDIPGIGEAKALQIASAFALAKRCFEDGKPKENSIYSLKEALAIAPELKSYKQEHLIGLYLNASNILLRQETISIGTLDKSLAHSREIFAPAIESRAAGIILLHNHPSGDPNPSKADSEVFKDVIDSGKILGITVIDFIITAKKGDYSYFENLQDFGGSKKAEYISDGIQYSLFDFMAEKKAEYKRSASESKKLRILDLFAGIGGIKLGFENAGFECALSNDLDKNCKYTYDINFAGSDYKGLVIGDISQITSQSLPEFNILTGGFPCQPFSIAGYRKGFTDEGRGNLFFEIVRILKDRKPWAFLLENVKNLKTHNEGETIQVIYTELQKLGYHVIDRVLNTMEYGNIPQNRERIYIAGFLDQEAFNKFSFPEKIKLTKTIEDCLEKNPDEKYYYNGKPLYAKLKKEITKKGVIHQWRRKYVRENKNRVCPTLTANMGMGGHNVPLVLDEKGIRKLTPRECANFQGFPKTFKLPDIADSALYKQFGNSVSVPVIHRIAENMKKALNY